MAFLAYVGAWAALWLISYLLRPEPEAVKNNLVSPRVEEGTPVPFVWGRTLVKAPAVLWFARSKAQQFGNEVRYFANVLFAIAISNQRIDDTDSQPARLVALWAGDKPPPAGTWQEDPLVQTDPQIKTYTVLIPLGGQDFTGGAVEFNPGGWTTTIGRRLDFCIDQTNEDPTLFPPHRGTVTAFLTATTQQLGTGRFWLGNSGYPPTFGFEITNPVNIPGVNPAFMEIGDGDANPVGILYTVLVNGWGCLKRDPSTIDTTSFGNAALVLWLEQNGISRAIYQEREAGSILGEEILRQIDAVLFEDPDTLLVTLKLIREDYDVGTLEVFDASNMLGNPKFSRMGYHETRNRVRVNYTSRHYGYTEAMVLADEQANHEATGGVVRSATFNFPGVSNKELAARLASRELRATALPLAKVSFACDRTGLLLRPGDVFLYEHPTNAQEYVMRVSRVDTGDLDNSTMVVDAIEDRWAVGYTVNEPPDEVVVTDTEPERIDTRWVGEAPRWLLSRGNQAGRGWDPDVPRAFHLAAPSDDSPTYRALSTRNVVDGPFSDTEDAEFMGHTTVATTYLRTLEPYDTTTGLVVNTPTGYTFQSATETQIRLYGHNMIQVGEEVMFFESATDNLDGTHTLNDVWRGCLDTVPVEHPVGTSVFFINTRVNTGDASVFARVGATGLDRDDDMAVKLLATKGFASNHPDDALEDEFTVISRPLLPYPVTSFELDGTNDPPALEEEGVDLVWVTRDRNSLEVFHVGEDLAEDTSGENTTYKIVVRKDGRDDIVNSSGHIDDALDENLARSGYGDLGVRVRSARNMTLAGVTTELNSWQDPEISLVAYEWRNLLVNPRFPGDSLTPWTITAGDPEVFPSGPVSGSNLVRGAGANEIVSWQQQVDVSGYSPSRMRAALTFMTKRTESDADDTVSVVLTSRDSGGALDTTTYAATVPGTNWSRQTLEIATLNTATEFLRVAVTQEAEGEIETTPNAAISDFVLRLGQFTDQLLANPSFESGATSWTTVAGSWTADSVTPGEGDDRIIGNSNATNTLRQDVTITAGYNNGWAVLEYMVFQESSLLNSHAVVTISSRDGSGELETQTDTFTPITNGVWYRRRVFVRCPAGATTVRVDLSGVRDSGTVNLIAFDGLDLRVHKYLDPQYEDTLTFAPTTQELPSDIHQWRTAYPAVAEPIAIFNGTLVGGVGTEPELEVEDGAFANSKISGYVDAVGSMVRPAYEFRRSAGAGARVRSNPTFANFASTESFTVRVLLDVRDTDSTFTDSDLCGLLGTTDGQGWALALDGNGFPTATIVGPGGTATVALTDSVATGGLEWVALAYDAGADTLRVMSRFGQASVSTASVGEFQCTDLTTFTIGLVEMMMGTSFTGLIAQVEIWDEVVSYATLSAMWTHGSDEAVDSLSPTEAGTQAGSVCFIAGEDDSGVLYGFSGVGGWPHVYDPDTEERPLATCGARVNMVSYDLTAGTNWASGGSPTYTPRATHGPDGRMSADLLRGTNAMYRELTVNSLANVPTVNFVFQAAGTGGVDTSTQLRIELRSNAGVLLEFALVTITETFQTYRHKFTSWTGTGDGKIRVYASNTGTTKEAYIAGPIFVDQDTDNGFPVLIHTRGTSAATGYYADGLALGMQLLHEGEIVVRAKSINQNADDGVLVNMTNGFVGGGSTNDDRRQLRSGFTGLAHFDHYDGATPTNVTSETGVLDWREQITLRGRWNRAGLLEGSSVFAGIREDQTPASDYDRTATWTLGTNEIDALGIGSSDGVADFFNGMIYEITLRAREEIL